jgi:hypothetical protein
MTRNEYEARRRRLDEELRAAMELLKAGHQAQVQMLDLLLKLSTEGTADPAAPDPSPIGPLAEEPARRPRRRGPGELVDEVIALLPKLPELFTKDDVAQSLAEPADRSSLFRVLQELQALGWYKLDRAGQGRYPTVYRQTRPAPQGAANAAETV